MVMMNFVALKFQTCRMLQVGKESEEDTESYIKKETENCTTDTLLSLIFGDDD